MEEHDKIKAAPLQELFVKLDVAVTEVTDLEYKLATQTIESQKKIKASAEAHAKLEVDENNKIADISNAYAAARANAEKLQTQFTERTTSFITKSRVR